MRNITAAGCGSTFWVVHCVRAQQEVNDGGTAPESSESRKLGGPRLPARPFYQEEAGGLFVLDPGILCAYLASAPFPSAEQVMR